MDEFISREEITNRLHVYANAVDKTNTLSCVLRNIVRDTPAADVRPVVPARWIPLDIYKSEGNYKCSHCNQPCYVPECMGEPMYAVCPNCGADMRPISQRLNDASVEDDLFPELTAEEKAENKAEAKRIMEVDQIANYDKKVYLCADCRLSPPSSGDGKPCCACDPDDPLVSCYEKREAER